MSLNEFLNFVYFKQTISEQHMNLQVPPKVDFY